MRTDNARSSAAIQGIVGTGLAGFGALGYYKGISLLSQQSLPLQLAHQLANQPVPTLEPVTLERALEYWPRPIVQLWEPLKGKDLEAARKNPTGFFAAKFEELRNAHQ